ncbi:hypothetical protein K8R03_01540 [Candidatus Kaiserbacteria bacterium]|nr:hypothetical protein [Candidatus Kaiserbacteria bacterium]
MNSKAIIAILGVIIIAGGAWMLFGSKSATGTDMTKQDAAMQQQVTTTAGSNAATGSTVTGVWKSDEDAKFVREFKADGSVTDSYEGDASATETGTFTAVNPADATGLPVPAENLAGMTVMKLSFPKTGDLYFTINTLTATKLEMTNLSGRGNMLMFTKVQ